MYLIFVVVGYYPNFFLPKIFRPMYKVQILVVITFLYFPLLFHVCICWCIPIVIYQPHVPTKLLSTFESVNFFGEGSGERLHSINKAVIVEKLLCQHEDCNPRCTHNEKQAFVSYAETAGSLGIDRFQALLVRFSIRTRESYHYYISNKIFIQKMSN